MQKTASINFLSMIIQKKKRLKWLILCYVYFITHTQIKKKKTLLRKGCLRSKASPSVSRFGLPLAACLALRPLISVFPVRPIAEPPPVPRGANACLHILVWTSKGKGVSQSCWGPWEPIKKSLSFMNLPKRPPSDSHLRKEWVASVCPIRGSALSFC